MFSSAGGTRTDYTSVQSRTRDQLSHPAVLYVNVVKKFPGAPPRGGGVQSTTRIRLPSHVLTFICSVTWDVSPPDRGVYVGVTSLKLVYITESRSSLLSGISVNITLQKVQFQLLATGEASRLHAGIHIKSVTHKKIFCLKFKRFVRYGTHQ